MISKTDSLCILYVYVDISIERRIVFHVHRYVVYYSFLYILSAQRYALVDRKTPTARVT